MVDTLRERIDVVTQHVGFEEEDFCKVICLPRTLSAIIFGTAVLVQKDTFEVVPEERSSH